MKSRYLIRIYFLFFLFSLPFFAESNEAADSLIRELHNEKQDSAKVILYTQLAQLYLQSDHDSAIIYANRAFSLANRIDYSFGIGHVYMVLGHLEVVQNDMFKALDYYLKAYASFVDNNLIINLPAAYLLLGNVSYTIGNYPDALDYYQKGQFLADSLHNKGILFDFYNNLGELNVKLEDYAAAIEYLNHALTLTVKSSNTDAIALILVNLGVTYSYLEDYKRAEDYLNQAHEIYEKSSNKRGLFNVYEAYASIEQKRGDYTEAINYFQEGHAYLLQVGTEYLGPMSILNAGFHSNIGYSYLKNENYQLAEQNLLKGYEISEQSGQIEFMKITSQRLSELYEVINEPLKALRYAKLFKVYSDSISKDENIKKLTQLKMQFEFNKKMKQNEMERVQFKSSQKRKELVYIMVSSSIFLALIILFLLFRLLKLKVKRISLERQNLISDLDYKNKELTTNVMYLLKKNEFIISISDKLKKARYNFKPENRKMVDDIIRELEHSSSADVWKDFEVRFQEVHSEFYNKLNSRFPDLSPNELKLCAFLRLNMSTKEISTITFQSAKSISMARFRLRKKMGIGSYENLINFLNQF